MHVLRWTVLAFLGLTAGLAPAAEKPAARVDQYGDPLPEGAIARLGTVRLRARCAWCLAFSSDGKRLAAGYGDMTARIWDTATGLEVVRFRGSGLGQVQQVALSPDGTTLATLDVGQVIRFWDARTGKHLRQAGGRAGKGWPSDSTTTFTFSPDSQTLYASRNGSVEAIAVAEGKTAAQPAAPEQGLLIDAVSADGATAISVGDGGRLVVWDLRSSKTVAAVVGPQGRDPLAPLAVSAGGKRLAVATGGDEPAVVVYDLTTGKELSRCKGHQARLSSLTFSPDGKALATGSGDLTARLWDAESGKERWSYRGYKVAFYWVRVAFAPDGKTVGVAGWDGIVRLLDAATGKERIPLPGHLGWVWHLAVTPDGKTVFTTGEDQTLRLWDVLTGKEIRVLQEPRRDTYDPRQRKVVHAEEYMRHLDLTADGKTLVGKQLLGLRIWDLSAPDRPRAWELSACRDAALSPDGKALATWEAGELRLRDFRTRRMLPQTAGPLDGGYVLRFSPDGRTLAADCSRAVVRLYDVRTWQETATLPGSFVQDTEQLAFSPDSQLLAANGLGQCVNVWEVASGRLRRQIERKESRNDVVAFSPDGRRLAIAGWDRAVSIHDLATGRIVHVFRGHDDKVCCLAFTPDGQRLISGSYDTTALVWDMEAVPAPAIREVQRTAKELGDLWERLAGEAVTADAAMRDLAASPGQAAELLGRSLKPAEKGQPEQIAQLVKNMDSDSFAERERASASLEELGEEAAEALRGALAGQPSPEVRRRAEELLERVKGKGRSLQRLRGLRAVQLLEWIGTAEARRVLESVASGAPAAELTRAAAGALTRLKKR